jgi:hypothetical protein
LEIHVPSVAQQGDDAVDMQGDGQEGLDGVDL